MNEPMEIGRCEIDGQVYTATRWPGEARIMVHGHRSRLVYLETTEEPDGAALALLVRVYLAAYDEGRAVGLEVGRAEVRRKVLRAVGGER